MSYTTRCQFLTQFSMDFVFLYLCDVTFFWPNWEWNLVLGLRGLGNESFTSWYSGLGFECSIPDLGKGLWAIQFVVPTSIFDRVWSKFIKFKIENFVPKSKRFFPRNVALDLEERERRFHEMDRQLRMRTVSGSTPASVEENNYAKMTEINSKFTISDLQKISIRKFHFSPLEIPKISF